MHPSVQPLEPVQYGMIICRNVLFRNKDAFSAEIYSFGRIWVAAEIKFLNVVLWLSAERGKFSLSFDH